MKARQSKLWLKSNRTDQVSERCSKQAIQICETIGQDRIATLGQGGIRLAVPGPIKVTGSTKGVEISISALLPEISKIQHTLNN